MLTRHPSHKLLVPFFCITAFFAVAEQKAQGAPPALFYSLLSLNHGKEESLKRAQAAVASEVSGKLMKRADDVALVNPDFNLAVHCRATGSKTCFVTIIVAHRSSFPEAKGLALNIRRGMETGIYE
jgi:hypothetical protein